MIKSRHSDIAGFRKEWICKHGIGHHRGVHGCDGCCFHEPEMENTTLDKTMKEDLDSKNSDITWSCRNERHGQCDSDFCKCECHNKELHHD